MRIVFMGTPDFAVPTLSAILAAGHKVVAVYTRAPRPAGRGMGERKSPVHAYAEAAHLPVLAAGRGPAGCLRRARSGRGRGSRLWADPAAPGAGGTPQRLPRPARLRL